MMTPRLALVLAATVSLAACATTSAPPSPMPVAKAPPAPAPTAAFRTADFAWSATPGTGRINGKLTYRVGGRTYSCAATGVNLVPVTPWTRARMVILYQSDHAAASPAAEVRTRTPPGRTEDYSQFVKHADCDAAGNFIFDKLADGGWFAITVAKAPVASAASPDIAIMRHVEVKGGRAVSLSL